MERAFAELLKEYRLAAGLTQEALAERAGLGVRSIQALEGGSSRPQRETLRRLADALALSEAERARFMAAGAPSPRRPAGTGVDAFVPPPSPVPQPILPLALPALFERLRVRGEALPGSGHAVAIEPHPYSEPRHGAPASAGGHAWPQLASQATILVGRAREITLLDRHLEGQGPPLLFLTGQPGIGKSRLLREAAGRASAQGWRVLVGGCTRGGQQPFAPLLQALQRHLAARAPAERRLDLRGCAWLVRLLPELAADEIEPLPGWVLPPEQERRLMFDAVRRLLANVAGPSGTLLLLDDLHWAGADALDLLASLLHQPPAAPLRVIGAARDSDVPPDHPLSLTLAELAEAQLVRPQLVRPLAPAEAETLFLHLLDEREGGAALAVHVARRTGGVPFFLVSYARGLESQEDGEEVPWDVRQSIVRRITALPEAARDLLGATAVVGRVAPRTLLPAVLARPERDLLAALEAACRAGLLEEVGEDAYGFAHDVIREVVEAELGLARRRLLHRQVAEALEHPTGTAPVETLAYHFRQAGELASAAIYLEQAGDLASAQFAHAAAADHYQNLAACLKGLGRVSEHLRACEKQARALSNMLRHDAALAVLEQAVATHRVSADVTEMGRIEALIGETYAAKGAFGAGIARLLPVMVALESHGPSTSLALTSLALANLYFRNGQPDSAVTSAWRTTEIARREGDRHLLVSAQSVYAYALIHLSRAEEALQAMVEAVSLAESMDDPGVLMEALGYLAWVYEERGEYEPARQVAERYFALSEQAQMPFLAIWAMCRLGLDAFLTGDWSGARAYLERGIAITQEVGITEGHSYALPRCDMGRLLHAEGTWDEATRCFDDVLAALRGTNERILFLVAQGHLAEREVLTGQPLAARERLFAVLEEPVPEERMTTQYILPVLALAHYELGELDQAAAIAKEAIRRARGGTCRLGLVQALRVQALVLLAQDRHEEVVRALEEGLAVARGMPYPHGEGRLLHVYGRLHARRGEPAPAREQLEAALAIFRRLGARPDIERAEQELATLDP